MERELEIFYFRVKAISAPSDVEAAQDAFEQVGLISWWEWEADSR